jgi:hypothetical protein
LQLFYWLEDDTPFVAEYLIINATDEPLKITILALIDYHQQEFYFNDHIAKRHSVRIKPGKRTVATLGLPRLDRGVHDFILLAVKNEDPAKISNETNDQVVFHRANIFVNDLAFPKSDYRNLGVKSALAHRTHTPAIRLLGNDIPSEPLLTDKVGTDQSRTYFLHINNAQDMPIRSAIVAFLNGRQIPIPHETGDAVLYYKIPAGRQDAVPVTLNVPSCHAGCELLVLSIDNPYTSLEPERGVMAQQPTRVRAANRLIIYSGRR